MPFRLASRILSLMPATSARTSASDPARDAAWRASSASLRSATDGGHVGQVFAPELVFDPPLLIEGLVQVGNRLSCPGQVVERALLSRAPDLPVNPAFPSDAGRLAVGHAARWSHSALVSPKVNLLQRSASSSQT
jgi:hypothetical protein